MGTRSRLLPSTAIMAAVAVMAGTAAARLPSAPCHPTGKILVNRDGVAIWVTHAKSASAEHAWVCGLRSGAGQLLYPGSEWVVDTSSTQARVTQLRRAGRFVGFFLAIGGVQGGRTLFVFNPASGRLELADSAYCGGRDECPGPWMTRYVLAANGWRSGFSGASSVKLGPDAITPTRARALTACRLLRPADVAVVFPHGATSASSPGRCTYTSKTDPARVLTVKLRTGMSRVQQRAAEHALESWEMPYGNWWPQNDDFFVRDNPFASGHLPFAAIVNGADVRFNVRKAGSSAGGRLGHLAVVALDRLFGVPVRRAR
jgi:hypothetical protein